MKPGTRSLIANRIKGFSQYEKNNLFRLFPSLFLSLYLFACFLTNNQACLHIVTLFVFQKGDVTHLSD